MVTRRPLPQSDQDRIERPRRHPAGPPEERADGPRVGQVAGGVVAFDDLEEFSGTDQ
ncbi:hypothetical protein ACFROC_27635 [Nocardia tengchongensis]|uniref:hypothetical protein n=1 Tax=Nocardia tengchongensis TaxID=2055889 RepID=UPI0036C89F6C